MIATTAYAAERFAHFNHLIFNDELPPLTILPSRARTYLGRYECDVRRRLLGRAERCNHRMRINTTYDLPEAEIDDIIVHEMIHYFISFKGLGDTSAHGRTFRAMMDDINARHGRHISISRRRSAQMDSEDQRVRRHYVCVMTLPDGRTAFTPVTEQSMFVLWSRLRDAFGAAESAWYVSHDAFFNAYRKVSAGGRRMPRLRTYPIDPDVLAAHLGDARRLELRGRRIVALDAGEDGPGG